MLRLDILRRLREVPPPDLAEDEEHPARGSSRKLGGKSIVAIRHLKRHGFSVEEIGLITGFSHGVIVKYTKGILPKQSSEYPPPDIRKSSNPIVRATIPSHTPESSSPVSSRSSLSLEELELTDALDQSRKINANLDRLPNFHPEMRERVRQFQKELEGRLETARRKRLGYIPGPGVPGPSAIVSQRPTLSQKPWIEDVIDGYKRGYEVGLEIKAFERGLQCNNIEDAEKAYSDIDREVALRDARVRGLRRMLQQWDAPPLR